MIQIATFNCEWRKSASFDAAVIRERILEGHPDVVCLTEAYRDFFGVEGYTIEAAADGRADGRRKVLLWSRNPWTDVDAEGPAGLPAGRFVSGRTETASGEVAFIGVCIPYRWAGVRSGTPKREPWELHLQYLSLLGSCLPTEPRRLVILGDFNQRVPRKYQLQAVHDALNEALLTRLDLATSGLIEPIGRQAIDHICHSRDLMLKSRTGLSNARPSGGAISDHFGVHVELAPRPE